MTLSPSAPEMLGGAMFAFAILHSFAVGAFRSLAARHPSRSRRARVLRWLSEIELAFVLWALAFLALAALLVGGSFALELVAGESFTEPLFVFAILLVASTRPVIAAARASIALVARSLPLGRDRAFLASALTVGPLLGTLITEPAAMTMTALVLNERCFRSGRSDGFTYRLLGTLFVNVSIGGVLTHFAAPPVLMVARAWQWDTAFMLRHFGWRAASAVIANAALLTWSCGRELTKDPSPPARAEPTPPRALIVAHLAFLASIVFFAHRPFLFVGLLILFLGLFRLTRAHQDRLRVKESLGVAVFLASLVILGSPQAWWLRPLVARLSDGAVFIGATCLTAFADNAALTYLGSRIAGTSEAFRYALLAGAVAGGGLTLLANAPNLVGFSILRGRLALAGPRPGRLLLAALPPTLVAMAAFWL